MGDWVPGFDHDQAHQSSPGHWLLFGSDARSTRDQAEVATNQALVGEAMEPEEPSSPQSRSSPRGRPSPRSRISPRSQRSPPTQQQPASPPPPDRGPAYSVDEMIAYLTNLQGTGGDAAENSQVDAEVESDINEWTSGARQEPDSALQIEFNDEGFHPYGWQSHQDIGRLFKKYGNTHRVVGLVALGVSALSMWEGAMFDAAALLHARLRTHYQVRVRA
uniref:Uncharacterized protein n=1 Tax=Chlamydomonas leiostraca TaxID=1034604 RepID=A0A7S0S4U6_9CHLO|mmetsp:Transcript_7728/g.19206  ORF Transcript_7728/g.19206 Transcript_7728/m.19206 type:complete len:219 (+) Transcript_7728:232-888(+)